MPTIKLEIVTAEHLTFSEEVNAVIAPGAEGQLGILPFHAPLMTMLEPGELCIRKGGEEIFLATSGGFLEVLDNQVVVLADTAERAEEIDMNRAEAAKQRAEEQLKLHMTGADLIAVEAALRRSLTRLKVVGRKRRIERRVPS